MATARCECRCHSCIPWTIARSSIDHVDAVSACELCINNHCAVLLERRIWDTQPVPVKPIPAEFCYVDRGEGDE